jgi:MFS family permease
MGSAGLTAAPRGRSRLRLSRRAGFWAVAFAFFAATAFSTAPSSLYGLYVEQEGLSSLDVSVVYAVYACGLLVSLVLVGHVSDWYGRRAVLLPATVLAIAAAAVFVAWTSLPGLLVARVLTGLAVGAIVATASAFIADLDAGHAGGPTRRATVVATIANIGGLGAGPLIAGLLALDPETALTLPFLAFLAALVLALVAVAVAPEGHPPSRPLPRYRPQRLAVPAAARPQFVAATAGVLLCFAVFGLFAGLAGTFLAETGHPSPALAGAAILATFGAGVCVQIATLSWPVHRLIAYGLAPTIAGLVLVVASAWTSPPSLALFLAGGVVAGAGGGAIFSGSLTLVIQASGPEDRAAGLAMFFTAGYIGVSLPVLGLGVALEHVSSRTALLGFGAVVSAGILVAARVLVRPAR